MNDQRGFTVIEGIVIAVIVLGLAGVGYWVIKSQADKDNSSTSQQVDNVEAPTAPEVDSADDLQAVERALDSLNPEAGSAENKELEQQTDGL